MDPDEDLTFLIYVDSDEDPVDPDPALLFLQNVLLLLLKIVE